MKELAFAVERVEVLVEGGYSLHAAAARVALEEGVEVAALLREYELPYAERMAE